MIELDTFSDSVNPFFEFDSEALSEAAALFPDVSLSSIAEMSYTMVRKVSPLLLGELPYKSTDNFFKKCLKYVIYSTRALLLNTHKIQDALKIHHASKEVIDRLSDKTARLEEEIFNNFHETLSILFDLEANKALRDSGEIPKEDLIEGFVGSFRVTLYARRYMMVGRVKELLDDEMKEALCTSFHSYLEMRIKTITPGNPRELNDRVEAYLELANSFHTRKTALTEELQDIEAFLNEPLNRQLPN